MYVEVDFRVRSTGNRVTETTFKRKEKFNFVNWNGKIMVFYTA